MDVRIAHAGLVARTDRPDAVALDDRRALGHSDGAQVGEGHRPAVRGLDRHAPAVARDRAGERDEARGRRAHGRADRPGDVEAAMEPGRLRLLRVEGERLQYRPVGRPRPGARGRHDRERDQKCEQESPHEPSPHLCRQRPATAGLDLHRFAARRERAAECCRVGSVRLVRLVGQPGERLFATVRMAAAVVNAVGAVVTELSQRSAVEVVSGHVRQATKRPRRPRGGAFRRPRAQRPRPVPPRRPRAKPHPPPARSRP